MMFVTCDKPATPIFVFLFLKFLSLASSILNFITTSMLKSRNNFIRNYLSVSLTEQHMATLASIIKDVDKDVKGTHKEKKTTYHENDLKFDPNLPLLAW